MKKIATIMARGGSKSVDGSFEVFDEKFISTMELYG